MRFSPSLLSFVLLSACVGARKDPFAVFDKVYSTANLPTQVFSLSTARDTTVTGPAGTVLRIPANAFVDSTGNAVAHLELELKEVLDPMSMVMGDLTTTSNGVPLQTGGMLWLAATSEGHAVNIAADKHIDAAVPCDTVWKGMMRYTGTEDETGIDWVDPAPMVANEVNRPSAERVRFMLDSIHQLKVTNVRYLVDGKYPTGQPEVDSLVSVLAWADDGLKITKDSSFMFKGHRIDFFKSENQKWNPVVGYTYSDTRSLEKGTNYYLEDPNTHYLFAIKQLGWANIDRLYSDPRTQEVMFVTNVAEADDFESLYVTLLIKEAGMYLPGYRKKDGTFGYSHGDNEAMELPVGAEVIVLATAYEDDQPLLAIQKIKLEPTTRVHLELARTTMDKLKADLKAAI